MEMHRMQARHRLMLKEATSSSRRDTGRRKTKTLLKPREERGAGDRDGEQDKVIGGGGEERKRRRRRIDYVCIVKPPNQVHEPPDIALHCLPARSRGPSSRYITNTTVCQMKRGSGSGTS
jgi:hypothetical protein